MTIISLDVKRRHAMISISLKNTFNVLSARGSGLLPSAFGDFSSFHGGQKQVHYYCVAQNVRAVFLYFITNIFKKYIKILTIIILTMMINNLLLIFAFRFTLYKICLYL